MTFLIYGATGYVGAEVARTAVRQGLRPVIAGRNAAALQEKATELDVECRAFDLESPSEIAENLHGVGAVLHCAGPYLHTSAPMVEACIRTGTNYLDLTGEIPVFQAIAARGSEAKAEGVMLLPGVGFDVVPTDCLALHLKERLPSATRLTIAFSSRGPAGLPPGTQRTAIELLPYGNFIRRDGRVQAPSRGTATRVVDFGDGPTEVTRLSWGDVFTGYYSTGIPNIEAYAALPRSVRRSMAIGDYIRPVFRIRAVREFLKRGVRSGPSEAQRARSSAHVWAEVEDDQGRVARARMHGPEAGLDWTVRAALAAIRKVLGGDALPGYQTPASAFGADFALEVDGVEREDVE